jgi:hypothetical protein
MELSAVYTKTLEPVPAEVAVISTERLDILGSILETQATLAIPVPAEVVTISTERVELLSTLVDLRKGLDLPINAEVAVIDSSRYYDLLDLRKSLETVTVVEQNLFAVQTEHDGIMSEMIELSKSTGFNVCQVCGSVVDPLGGEHSVHV